MNTAFQTISKFLGLALINCAVLAIFYPVQLLASPAGGIQLNPQITNSTCGQANGSIALVPTNGTAPYAYSWNGGSSDSLLTGLVAGSYSITVTDAQGGSAIDTFNITTTSSPVLSLIDSYNPLCAGTSGGTDGWISVGAAGGTAPYLYNWSNSGTTATIANLSPGTYYVTVTDNSGCTDSLSHVVRDTSQFIAIGFPSNPTCFGATNGSVSILQTFNGTGPFSYNWSDGQNTSMASGLNAGL